MIDDYEGILSADGFDDAVIGVATDFTEPRLIYSVSKCLEILQKDMSELDALEYFTYNVSGAFDPGRPWLLAHFASRSNVAVSLWVVAVHRALT